jgi:hypothetical protein
MGVTINFISDNNTGSNSNNKEVMTFFVSEKVFE